MYQEVGCCEFDSIEIRLVEDEMANLGRSVVSCAAIHSRAAVTVRIATSSAVELLHSKMSWFREIQICQQPQGSMFVVIPDGGRHGLLQNSSITVSKLGAVAR